MARWGEDVDYEAQQMKDFEGRFTINFKKIFNDVDEISQRTMEITDKHPKDSLMKAWAGTMVGMFILFLLAYQVFIVITIPFFVFYIIALLRIAKCWKSFRYSPVRFWVMTVGTVAVMFTATTLLKFFF